ncbi:MAG TPA: methyltransferase domain-containing protein, partial [Acidobacteriota bacterium]
EAMAFEMPYPDSHFDRIVSNLVFHHLTTENKQRTFREMHRVLRPDGFIAISDFGPPTGRLMSLISNVMKRFEETSDNLQGLLPVFAEQAGFVDVLMRDQFNSLFGTIWIFRAKKVF